MSSNPFPLPHSPRGVVFAQLFALLKTVPAPAGLQWQTFSTHLQIWDSVDPANQPAMFMYRGPQTASQDKAFGVTKWHWTCTIWVYYRTDGLQCTDEQAVSYVDDFIDSVEQVMQTEPFDNRLTLSGTCYHCFIDGKIVFDDGLIDSQAVLIIPLSIYI